MSPETMPHTDFAQPLTEAEGLKPVYREAVLKDLLGIDYEHAQTSGLIDAFEYNPSTGEDALLHILGGDINVDNKGTYVPGGFHHEPSAPDSRTFVDRSHLEEASAKQRKEYREFPYEPYTAQVVIDGLDKVSAPAKEDNKAEELSVQNNMFPKEYDALTVIKTIVQARDQRDTTKDIVDPDENVVITQGEARLLDGNTTMTLRMILDLTSGQIITAYPKKRNRSGLMKLSREETRTHLGL